uniref:Uncharacterized protein n=1 Tax=Oryza meridionalis TaxID=40149 RepID=A0A0E0ER39_9ORYZ
MSGETTKFLGPLLPPFLKIDILPEALRGNIDPTSCQLSGKPLSRPCEPFFPSPDGTPTDGRGSGGGSMPVAEKKKKKKLSGVAVAAIAVGGGTAALLALVLLGGSTGSTGHRSPRRLPLVEKCFLLRFTTFCNPGFPTRTTNPRLKIAIFSPGSNIPVGNTNRE